MSNFSSKFFMHVNLSVSAGFLCTFFAFYDKILSRHIILFEEYTRGKLIMRIIRKFFKILIAVILIPTFIIIGMILWSYITGNALRLPELPYGNVSDTKTDNNFLLQASIQTEEVYAAGSKEALGQRGYIRISRAELAAMTPSQYWEFYEKVLKGSSYLWFSVICPDGTGLFIPDCPDGAACFCSLDELGRQIDIYGYLMIQDGSCIYQEAD